MKLALFDFDGTITKVDSMVDFIQFAVGKCRFLAGLVRLLPMLVLYKLKVIPNDKAKQRFLAHYFKGYSEQEFKKIAREYSLFGIDNILKVSAVEKINWHKQQGHKVVIVSASIDCWLQAWCDKNQIDLIATQLVFENEQFTGLIKDKNCYGMQKALKIKEKYNLEDYSEIYAYGDTTGDKEMLALADHRFYRHFTS